MGQQKNRGGRDKTSPSGRLRIVAGKWRSRLLPVADEDGLRPTPERVRETLFNWLSPEIEGCRCLDLFAGTGALGLEALSRGARSCTFVERASEPVRLLRENIRLLDATGATVRQGDAATIIRSLKGEKFDVIFLDPPFADDLLEDLCRLLAKSDLLKCGSKIYLEQEREQKYPQLPMGWVAQKDKLAGNVRYTLAQVQELTE